MRQHLMWWYKHNCCRSQTDEFEAEVAHRLTGVAGGKSLDDVGLAVTEEGLEHFLRTGAETIGFGVRPSALAARRAARTGRAGAQQAVPVASTAVITGDPDGLIDPADDEGIFPTYSPGFAPVFYCCYAPRIYDVHHNPLKGANPTPKGATKAGKPVGDMYISRVRFKVTMKWRIHKQALPCKLHWEERTTVPYPLPDGTKLPADGKYHDISNQNSDTVREFNARVADSRARASGTYPQPPAGREFLSVSDDPGFPRTGGGRTLTGRFWIVSGCPGAGTSRYSHRWRQDVSSSGQTLYLNGKKTYP